MAEITKIDLPLQAGLPQRSNKQ